MKTVSALFENSTVLYEDGDLIQRRMAYRIAALLTARCGVNVTFATEKRDANAAIIRLCNDTALSGGAWRIAIEGNTLILSAHTYYGYTGILKFLSSEAADAVFAMTDGYSVLGDRMKQSVTPLEAASRYAYARQGENRVMFHNVLWEYRHNGMRNQLSTEAIAQYAPDVVGLQEVSRAKRHWAGELDISKLLAARGYAEAVDPRVYNADTVENGKFGIADTSRSQKYPYLNAEQITLDGKTYYSLYNCTPLYYNTSTTKCLHAEYHWYEHQVDEENFGRDQLDCASKSLTWGVFEDLQTGKRYAVISTHMCTHSNGVKRKQAIEAVALIRKIAEEYQCPVLIGGDYNATYSQPNYVYFKEQGLLDVAHISRVSHEIRAHHTYPVYHEELDLMLPAEDDNSAIVPKGGIDHIMLANGEGVELALFGTVVDECTMSASDHYPIFADFTI